MAEEHFAPMRSYLTRTEAERQLSKMLESSKQVKKSLLQRIYHAQRAVSLMSEGVKEPQRRLIHALEARRKLTSELWDVNMKTVATLTSLPSLEGKSRISWGSKDCRDAEGHKPYEYMSLLLKQLHRSWTKPELTSSQVIATQLYILVMRISI